MPENAQKHLVTISNLINLFLYYTSVSPLQILENKLRQGTQQSCLVTPDTLCSQQVQVVNNIHTT